LSPRSEFQIDADENGESLQRRIEIFPFSRDFDWRFVRHPLRGGRAELIWRNYSVFDRDQLWSHAESRLNRPPYSKESNTKAPRRWKWERDDGFRRQTVALSRDQARERARLILARYSKEAYMTKVESWRDLGADCVEFTIKYPPSAD
jgi:hypothetical protein